MRYLRRVLLNVLILHRLPTHGLTQIIRVERDPLRLHHVLLLAAHFIIILQLLLLLLLILLFIIIDIYLQIN